jgi:23S rRNA pseudouridine2605 synthase
MNASDVDPLLPEAGPATPADPAPSGADDALADKPKRRRAPRKTVAAVDADAAAVVENTEPAAPADAQPGATEELAPRRKRAPRRVPADVVATADAGAEASPSAIGEPAQQAPHERPAAPTAIHHPGPSANDTGLEASAHGEGSGPGAESPEGAESAAAGPSADGGSAPGDRPRRSRNRRRGRRGGERGRDVALDGAVAEGEDADASLAAAAEAAPSEPAPLAVEVFAEVLSGAFDAEPPVPEGDAAAEPALPPKRVLAAEPDAPKLQKVLAQAGVGSRRDLEQMITEGRVTVNGQPAHTGQRISFGDRISVDGKPVRYRIAPPPPRVLAYHKPAGEVVTHDDPQQRPTVFRRLPRLPHGKWQSVGRLDINTEGLLLFTNSGELANQLMHPRFGVEREYAVRSLGVLSSESKDRLLEGLEIEGQRCGFKSIEDGGGEGVNHWYRVVITEGRNREVRKLFEAVGHAVSRLIRIRYGCVVLPRGLKRGVWVDLGDADVRDLRRLAAPVRVQGQSRPQGSPGQPGAQGLQGPQGPQAQAAPVPQWGQKATAPAAGVAATGAARGVGRTAPPRGPDRAPDRAADRARAPTVPSAPTGGRGPIAPSARRAARASSLVRAASFPTRCSRPLTSAPSSKTASCAATSPTTAPFPTRLQQTFRQARAAAGACAAARHSRRRPIPNPLQQTYDKRFTQGAEGGANRKGGGGDPDQIPDPMQTSMGYIGADAFRRKGGGGGGGGAEAAAARGAAMGAAGEAGAQVGAVAAGGGGRPGGGGGGNRGPRRGR